MDVETETLTLSVTKRAAEALRGEASRTNGSIHNIADKAFRGLSERSEAGMSDDKLDRALVFLGQFLAAEGLTGQLLGKQAGYVYEGAVKAIAQVQSERASMEGEIERLREALEALLGSVGADSCAYDAERYAMAVAALTSSKTGDGR